ncbi:MAG TPA: ABC transporter permease [Chitinophagaceae bacterium]|nr:ABC transporter permease [Chitinophagaceae bacterium]
MIKNYFIVGWRNIKRSRVYAFINIMGLAFGMAVFIAMLVYVNYKTSYDRWDSRLSSVYRVNVAQTWDEDKSYTAWTSPALGQQLLASMPEVQAVTRIADRPEELITAGDKQMYVNKVMAADSSFLTVMPFRLIYGNASTALKMPHSAIINTETSMKLFGTTDAVGKTFNLPGGKPYSVTGVFDDKAPSHLSFNICMSMQVANAGNWSAEVFITYVLLKPNTSAVAVANKTRTMLINGLASSSYESMHAGQPALTAPGSKAEQWLKTNLKRTIDDVTLEPVADIHLFSKAVLYRDAADSHPLFDTRRNNEQPVIFFSVTALLILVLACINYTNLAIARAGKRAKEAGIRKTIGARRYQLIGQFLAEAFVQTLLALAIAILLAKALLMLVNMAFNMQLDIFDKTFLLQNQTFVLQLLLMVVLVTLFSGGYPAFVLSSFNTAKVLKGETVKGIKGRYLQNSLLVLQFAISSCFIIGMMVVYLQLHYMHSNNPGFNTNQVLVLRPFMGSVIDPAGQSSKIDEIKLRLGALPGVSSVAITDFYPGTPSNATDEEAEFGDRKANITFNYVHFDYFKTLDMKFAAGRDFSTSYTADTVNSAIINETAAKIFGGKNPIGRQIETLNKKYTVVGVIKDSHIGGYNTLITPEVYGIGVAKGLFGSYRAVLVKVSGQHAAQALKAITNTWKTIEPAFPLRYSWLDQDFAKLMAKYERFGFITLLLAIISTIIALTGIFALSAFTASQRTKEIAIRKIFGASVGSITKLLTLDFLKLTLLALLVAFPIVFIISNQWLSGFAYQVTLSTWIFVLAGAGILCLAVGTVSIQAIRAALANPADNIKTE